MSMNTDRNLEIFIEQMVEAVHQENICPYAKNVLEQKKIDIVKVEDAPLYDFWTEVNKQCDSWNNNFDMIVVAMYTDIEQINEVQLQGGVDSLNCSLNVRNKPLWLLEGLGDPYTTVMIQDIRKLDDASKLFDQENYYQNYHPYRYWKTVESRRVLRERLTDPE